MADIVLNVEVRERTGTGGAREARRQAKVPGVLYGGPKGPVPISVRENEFRKALYTGKLLGHLVTLQHGGEKQQVIAKDVQFHPVTDEPVHFDLYRVEKGQTIHINVPVHFKNEDDCPALRQGGALEIVSHDLELVCRADQIPKRVADRGRPADEAANRSSRRRSRAGRPEARRPHGRRSRRPEDRFTLA